MRVEVSAPRVLFAQELLCGRRHRLLVYGMVGVPEQDVREAGFQEVHGEEWWFLNDLDKNNQFQNRCRVIGMFCWNWHMWAQSDKRTPSFPLQPNSVHPADYASKSEESHGQIPHKPYRSKELRDSHIQTTETVLSTFSQSSDAYGLKMEIWRNRVQQSCCLIFQLAWFS